MDKVDIFGTYDETGNIKVITEDYTNSGVQKESTSKNPNVINPVLKFTNPVQLTDGQIGGTITSSNYVKNKSGWSISQNGDVEFNTGNFRGNIILTQGGVKRLSISESGGLQFFDAAGNLSGSILGTSGGSISIVPTTGNVETFGDVVFSGANAIYPAIDNSTDLGTNVLGFRNGWFSSQLFAVNFFTQVSGTGGWSSDCVPDFAGNRNLGSSTKPWGNLYTQGTSVILKNLPTSAAGLPSGSLWNSSGVLHIV